MPARFPQLKAVFPLVLGLSLCGATCRTRPPEEIQDLPRNPPPMGYAMPKDPPGLPYTPPPPQPAPLPQPDLNTLPPRSDAPGDTAGTISCGQVRCFAQKEVCTWVTASQAWGCLPIAELDETALTAYRCDDASDCVQGHVCCRAWSTDVAHTSCVAKLEGCGALSCAKGGTACAKGEICKATWRIGAETEDESAKPVFEEVCTPDKPPPATCDGKKACPADKPICFWEDTEGKCVSEAEAKDIAVKRETESGISLRRCTRPADCATGLKCCGDDGEGSLWRSACRVSCGEDTRTDYCDVDADCPTLDGIPYKCRKARASGQADMPPWSKRCVEVEPG